MKSEIEIKDDIYSFIKGSDLERSVTGRLYKDPRPSDSVKEDIIISILDSSLGEIEEAFVNVNIYVKNLKKNNHDSVIDDKRCRALCSLAESLLKRGHGEDFHFTLEKQRVMSVNGRNEHFINNKLLYRSYNSDY